MDKFSAGLVLAVALQDSDKGADLYKMLKRNEGGPTPEAIRWFSKNRCKRVSIDGTGYIGEVFELNTSRNGLYNGGRYPINVKILEGGEVNNVNGHVYEYGIDQLTLI